MYLRLPRLYRIRHILWCRSLAFLFFKTIYFSVVFFFCSYIFFFWKNCKFNFIIIVEIVRSRFCRRGQWLHRHQVISKGFSRLIYENFSQPEFAYKVRVHDEISMTFQVYVSYVYTDYPFRIYHMELCTIICSAK